MYRCHSSVIVTSWVTWNVERRVPSCHTLSIDDRTIDDAAPLPVCRLSRRTIKDQLIAAVDSDQTAHRRPYVATVGASVSSAGARLSFRGQRLAIPSLNWIFPSRSSGNTPTTIAIHVSRPTVTIQADDPVNSTTLYDVRIYCTCRRIRPPKLRPSREPLEVGWEAVRISSVTVSRPPTNKMIEWYGPDRPPMQCHPPIHPPTNASCPPIMWCRNDSPGTHLCTFSLQNVARLTLISREKHSKHVSTIRRLTIETEHSVQCIDSCQQGTPLQKHMDRPRRIHAPNPVPLSHVSIDSDLFLMQLNNFIV